MLIRITCLVFFLCVTSVSCMADTSIVVLLDIEKGQKITYVDGDVIENENLYAVLAKHLSTKGRKSAVKLLFNPTLSFSEVINARGIIHAVGFSKIKFYFLSDDKKRMAEIEMKKPSEKVTYDLK